MWKKLWKLKVPSKIKIFGWRALRGLLPCNAILSNRHIIPEGGCPICHGGAQDIKHMIFTCARSEAVWRSIGVWERIRNLLGIDRSGSVLLEEIIRQQEQLHGLDIGLAELILTGGWYLWWERRQLTHGESVQPPPRSGLAIAALAKNYKLAGVRGAKVREGWRKPPDGCLMVNVDASFDDEKGCASTGAIIRDGSGSMIAASMTYIPYVVDTPMAEAHALKEGVMLAQHIGGIRLIFQSDCQEVVDIMSNEGFTANSGAAIYDEIMIVWKGFDQISMEHLHSEANQVAHELARRAMSLEQNCYWDDDPPDFIIPFMSNDVTIFDQ